MKTLYIVRHGKTNKAPNDLDRELLPIGIERMRKLGKHLYDKNVKVDVIYSSHAKRALQTAEIIADALQFPKEKIKVTEKLYLTSQDRYFDILVEQDDSVESILFVGHNPEISNVAQFFIPISHPICKRERATASTLKRRTGHSSLPPNDKTAFTSALNRD